MTARNRSFACHAFVWTFVRFSIHPRFATLFVRCGSESSADPNLAKAITVLFYAGSRATLDETWHRNPNCAQPIIFHRGRLQSCGRRTAPDALLQRPNLSAPDDFIVHPDRFLPTFGHASSPSEEQARRNTMTAGYVGNRHAGLAGLGQYRQLLVQRVTAATLNAGKNFDSINTRHSRMTRLTPSSSLCSYVRFKWGPFHGPTASNITSGAYWIGWP
jgi:hypothetical protein